MFSRFSFKRLFVAVAGCVILAGGLPAYGATPTPEVQVDLSVLQDLPVRQQPAPVDSPALINNPAPVEATPLLQPGDVSHAAPVSLPISEPVPPKKLTPAPKPAAIHKAAVVKKKAIIVKKKATVAKKKKAPAQPPRHLQRPVRKPQAATKKAPIKAHASLPVKSAPAKTPPKSAPIKKTALPQPAAIKAAPSAPMPAAPVAPVVKVPEKTAEAPKQTPPTAAPIPPPAENRNVPGPPPADPRETTHISLPFKAGVTDQLDGEITSTLQSQILPMLKTHPSWRLQINAYASPVENEPISARRVSLARALAVRSWLLDKGVAARRIDVRAAGLETGHEPPDRVDIVFLDPDAG